LNLYINSKELGKQMLGRICDYENES